MMILLAVWELGSNASTAAIATVISSIVAALVGYLTKRSSDQATVAISETTTRGDIEREAFERAKSFYTDVIDRQDTEIRDQATEIHDLESRVKGCETRVVDLQDEVARYRRTNQRLARGVHELRLALGKAATADPVLDEAVMDALGDDPLDN